MQFPNPRLVDMLLESIYFACEVRKNKMHRRYNDKEREEVIMLYIRCLSSASLEEREKER